MEPELIMFRLSLADGEYDADREYKTATSGFDYESRNGGRSDCSTVRRERGALGRTRGESAAGGRRRRGELGEEES